MIGLPFKKTILSVLLLAGVGAGGVAYYNREEAPPELPTLSEWVHERVVTRWAPAVALPPGRDTIVLMPIEGDARDALRQRLKEVLRDRGAHVLMPAEEPNPGWFDDALADLQPGWLDKLFGSEERQPQLLLAARSRFVDDADAVRLEVEWRQGDLEQKGALVDSGELREEIAKSYFDGDYLRYSIGGVSGWLRLLLWGGALLGASLLLVPIGRRVLAQESNLWTALLLAVVAAPGVLLGWLLTGFAAGWAGGTLTVIAAITSVLYGYLFLAWLDERR